MLNEPVFLFSGHHIDRFSGQVRLGEPLQFLFRNDVDYEKVGAKATGQASSQPEADTSGIGKIGSCHYPFWFYLHLLSSCVFFDPILAPYRGRNAAHPATLPEDVLP